MLDAVGIVVAVVLTGVVFGCTVGWEDDDDAVEEREEVVTEEDDALMVTLIYCDLNRGGPDSELLYIAMKKISPRPRFCVGRPFQK